MPNGRQRALLAVLGIPQWIPRAAKTRLAAPATLTALWRQAHDTSADQDNNQPMSPQSNHNPVTETTALGNPAQRPMPAKHSQPLTETVTDPQSPIISGLPVLRAETPERVQPTDQSLLIPDNLLISDSNVDQRINANLNAEQLVVAPRLNFRLQACEINQWVVLVNETDLQQPELRKLWHNILLAFKQPPVVHFSWPLSDGQRWQQAGGAKAALNGFLFRMGLDKRVGLMSELDDALCPDRLERLPHLSELLQQPLKKRLLWQLLKTQ